MDIRALIFDINGTLIDIETDERMEQAYRAIAHFLTYQGITLHRWEVLNLYFQIMKEQLVLWHPRHDSSQRGRTGLHHSRICGANAGSRLLYCIMNGRESFDAATVWRNGAADHRPASADRVGQRADGQTGPTT